MFPDGRRNTVGFVCVGGGLGAMHERMPGHMFVYMSMSISICAFVCVILYVSKCMRAALMKYYT